MFLVTARHSSCGKVMFSQECQSVCPQWRACVAEGCMAGKCAWQWRYVWKGGGMHGRGHVWQQEMHGRGKCMHARETTTEAGGTHPTGIHSSLYFVLK